MRNLMKLIGVVKKTSDAPVEAPMHADSHFVAVRMSPSETW